MTPEKSDVVTVKDLPVYFDSPKVTEFRFVESDPLPLQNYISCARKLACQYYCLFAENFKPLDSKLTSASKSVKDVYVAAEKYVSDEDTVLPKATAIAVCSLAGFVIGRKYGFRKFIYASSALVTAAAFCYPHETMRIIRTGIAHSQMTWEEFKRAPNPLKDRDERDVK